MGRSRGFWQAGRQPAAASVGPIDRLRERTGVFSAGYWAGPLWFRAVIDEVRARHPAVRLTATLDCGDYAGAVLAAVRARVPRILFTGDRGAADRLADIARTAGVTVLTAPPQVADPRNTANRATFWRSTLLDQ